MKIRRMDRINRINIGEKKHLFLGSLVLLSLAIILLGRSFYSFSWSDESLYMAEVHRLYLGERPFVDEWHPTQFYAALLLPLYRIYVGIKGTTEGIYLWSRFLNLLLAFIAAEISYYVLKRYFVITNWLSVAGGAMIILYSRANVGGISYHNFFFFSFIIAVMLLYIGVRCYRSKKGMLRCVALSSISGLFGGAAMIAVPTCILGMWIIYMVLIFYVIKKKTVRKFVPMWIHILGVTLLGAIYSCFVFSRISLDEFWNIFRYLFMDESHQRKEFAGVIKDLWSVFSVYGKNIMFVACLLYIMKLTLKSLHRTVDESLKTVMYVLVVMVCVWDLYRLSNSHMSTYIIFAFAIVGLLVLDESMTKSMFSIGSDANTFLLIPSFVIAFTFILASATIDPVYEGGVLIGLINLFFISKFSQSFSGYRYKIIVNFATAILISVMLGMLLLIRVSTVYRDAPLEMLDTVITKGPAKGLWTTSEHVEQYNACLEMMDYVNSLENEDEDKILVSVLAPWMYVCTNVQNGGISPWRIYLDEPLLVDYYQYHDIENLKYIIVLNEDMGGFIGAGNPEGTNCTPNKNKDEGFLYEYLNEKSYIKNIFKCGILYIKKEIREN